MENDNSNENKEGYRWRFRFITVLTLVDVVLWFYAIPRYLGHQLDDPWVYAFYYFVIPAIWIIYAWRFLAAK